MTNDELNEWFANLGDGFFGEQTYTVKGLEDTGKIVPYYGWYWRFIDFDGTDTLGYDGVHFVGFMGNNKWGYADYWLKPNEMELVREQCVKLATEPLTEASLQAFFDYLQTFKSKFSPPFVADWSEGFRTV